MAVASGIIVSDILCVAICYLGFADILLNVGNKMWIGIAGFCIVLGLGLKYLFAPMQKKSDKFAKFESTRLFAAGFLINFVNPAVFAIWIAWIGYSQTRFQTESEILLFLGGALTGIFTTDTLKALGAHKLRDFIRPEVMKIVFKVIGGIMILLSGVILWNIL